MRTRSILASVAVIGTLVLTSTFCGGYLGYKVAPKEVVQVDVRVTIAEAIRKLRVEPIALPINSDVTRTNFRTFEDAWFPGANKYIWGKGVWLEGSGFVTARFDLSRVRPENVRRTQDGFVINIGSPEIGWTVLPAEMVRDKRPPYQGSSVDAEEMSEWSRQARMEMERQLRAAACTAHIFDQASAKVKKQLPAFLALAGNVRITFETQSATC